MTLITWQAIGAVVGIVVCLIAFMVPIILRRKVKELEVFDVGGICVYCALWGLVLVSICGSSWDIIGVGLFGVTR